ncbi:MAG: glycosyltransferase family 39 protein, partial [Firmicutes bacterium]|nr:glycosyltransferase family 39 protein [Bacillota bacterium]
FRIIVFLMGGIAYGIFQSGDIPSFLDYCGKWNIWDSPHYIDIATGGYSYHIEDGQYLFLVFFPLYPFLMKLLYFIIPNYVISALTLSALCYSSACVLMYKLVTIDYGKAVAKKSVALLSVYPFAFFYGGIMTESLFFLTITATFLAIRRHNWLAAGILGMFAALTRSFGVFMIIPAAVEWAQNEKPIELIKNKDWKILRNKIFRFLPALIMIAGILIYLLINYITAGDPFIFRQYQKEHWGQEIQFFGKTLNLIWSKATSDSWTLSASIWLPEVVIVFCAAAVILYGVRRTRSMYVAFMLVYFAFNAGASWPLSLSRYLGCMFPMFWILADFTDRHKELDVPITVLSAVGFGIYLTGYITCHQIM